jgi:hypothetical protein
VTQRKQYEFFPDDVRQQLPGLYTTEGEKDPLMIVKFFTPDSGWTWYASEFDEKEGLFFGWVDGMEQELGYFLLSELQETTGPLGLPIERAINFEPTRLSEIKRGHRQQAAS